MAVATKKKKKVIRAPKVKKQVISWDGWEEMDGATFHRHRRYAFDHYYQEHKVADLLPHVYHWMKENGYSKEEISAAKARGSHNMTMAAIVAKCLSDGMPDYNEKHNEFWQELPGTQGEVKPVTENLRRYVDEAVKTGRPIMLEKKEEQEVKNAGPTITIQDRMREASAKMCEGIDEHVDAMLQDPKSFDPKGIKIVNILKGAEAKAAHARMIKGFYESERKEFEELLNYPTAAQLSKLNEDEQDMWSQLKEGYNHLDKNDVKKILAFFNEIDAACDMIAESQKATRKPRVKKAPQKDKLIAKLKYKKEDEALKLVSVNPIEVIGANELWVYNVKTRKIGKYVAANIDPTGQGRAGSGLTVKGTTIQGFDENLSVQKTLRKPDEQLAAFKGAGKVALRKFLDEIKAVDIKLNGRINPDIILLKVSN